MSPPPERRLGRYVIEEEIGRGMMGVVYRALDPDLGRTVALKCVQLAFAVPEDERASFEKRFLAEARAAAGLSHPGIVVVHDVGRDQETDALYIALEYLEGQTLEQLTAGGLLLPWRRALQITARLAEALRHAHARGIVHRDIKPANVMLLASGEPKIMDFGIAKLPAGHLTSTGQFFGTPAYMSPEQLSDEPLDGRSDLFSLGAVLYRLLTGRDPFAASSVPAVLARVAHYDPPAPSALVPEIPPAVDAVVARALAKDPARRYADGETFAAALEAVRTAPGPPSPALPARAAEATAPERAAASRSLRPSRRAAMILGGLTAAALAVAVVGPWQGVSVRELRTPPPAELSLDFEHPLRSGVLKVWVDDELVLEEPLESRVVEDLVLFRTRKGRAEATVKVSPGEHLIRLEVAGEGFSGSRRIRGTFETGATRRLQARVGGLIKKELSLWWAS